jgi:hypothetical protein
MENRRTNQANLVNLTTEEGQSGGRKISIKVAEAGVGNVANPKSAKAEEGPISSRRGEETQFEETGGRPRWVSRKLKGQTDQDEQMRRWRNVKETRASRRKGWQRKDKEERAEIGQPEEQPSRDLLTFAQKIKEMIKVDIQGAKKVPDHPSDSVTQ